MYSVLLVDDEPLVLVGIQSLLDWNLLGFRLVGTACNGKQALEIINKETVDIVITDIRMPVLDGLSLMKQCRLLPDGGPEFIVLTSFEEFNYAREALKQGATDYLIKLELTAELLHKSLKRTAAIREEKGDKARKTEASEDAAVFIDRVFLELLNRSYRTEEECLSRMQDNGIEFKADHYVAAVCNILFPSSMQDNEEQLRGYFFAVNMLKELLNREFKYHILALDKNRFLVFVAADKQASGQKSLESALRNSLSNGKEMIHRYFDIELLVGIGTIYSKLLSLADSYSEAIMSLDRADESNPVCLYSQLSIYPDAKLIDMDSIKERLPQVILCGDRNALDQLFESLQNSLDSKNLYYSQGLDICIEILYILLNILENAEDTLNSFFYENPEGYRCLYMGSTVSDLGAWLRIIQTSLLEYMTIQNRDSQKALADAVKKYIDHHFKEKITLGTIADTFHLSANYIGTTFKKQLGMHFNDYLARIRIETAKELLQSGRYRIYAVSEMLGFENQYYFSRVFKKITGFNPKDYLLQNDRHE